jgi:hypothetical protein
MSDLPSIDARHPELAAGKPDQPGSVIAPTVRTIPDQTTKAVGDHCDGVIIL